jgi:hypothetical protein
MYLSISPIYQKIVDNCFSFGILPSGAVQVSEKVKWENFV